MLVKSITRIFKKKIKGEELEKLAKVFEVKIPDSFHVHGGWTPTNLYVKLNAIPQEKSLKLEAYFHSDLVHCNVSSKGKIEETYRKGICFEKIKEIPYQKLIGIESE